MSVLRVSTRRAFRSSHVSATVVAAVGAALLAGCGNAAHEAAASGGNVALDDGKSYSLTMVVQNNSGQPLTLQGAPTVDNGATVQPGYPTTIAANTPGTFVAKNSGNGIQMWLHFTAGSGASVALDSDVHKTVSNTYTFTIQGSGLGFDLSKSGIGSGDNPTATATIISCGGSSCQTSAGGSQIVG